MGKESQVAQARVSGSRRWRHALSAGAAAASLLAASSLAAAGTAAAAGSTTPGVRAAQTTSGPSGPARPGYWMVASDGGVYQFQTTNYGGARGVKLNEPVVGGAPTADGLGYWMVASDGGIFTFGDAHFYGSTGNVALHEPIVGMAATPDGKGYWLVASDGGIFTFGDAGFYGSTGNVALHKPIVGMAPTSDGNGYWLVASDGGIFTFGDAGFHGSTGNVALHKPVVGMAPTSDGNGYWLVATDGGIFTFGDAGFYGSTGNVALSKPVISMAATPDGKGYWLVGSDGGVFTFGDAPFLGSAASDNSPAPIVALLETNNGYPFPPGGTGYDISQWQCPQNGGSIPSQQVSVAIVQVSGGYLNSSPNPCYAQETAWAGPNVSSYVFMSPLPNPPPPESLTGPAGVCSGDVVCENYNFGYYWARYWVNYSRNAGVNPNMWWLDVETSGGWDTSSSSWSANSADISGAVAGLRSMSVIPGIYGTALQWGEITGNQPTFPGIALWIPGAGNVSGASYSAQNFCTNPPSSYYQPYAGGTTVLVQYGYSGNGYSGPYSPYDQDYACQ
jgi:hypothetical protein